MARAVVGGSDAAVGAGYLDVEVRIAGLLANHLDHAHGAEGGVGDDVGNLAAGREAGGHAGGVLLGYADVEVLRGQLLAESAGLAALADIDVDYEDVGVFAAQLDYLVAEAVAGSFFNDIAHF